MKDVMIILIITLFVSILFTATVEVITYLAGPALYAYWVSIKIKTWLIIWGVLFIGTLWKDQYNNKKEN